MSTTSQAKPPPDLETIANDLAALKQDFATLIADVRASTTGRASAMAYDAAERISDTASSLFRHSQQPVRAGDRAGRGGR